MNSADQLIFQTEKQLKEFGDKISDAKKKPVESALTDLKKAYETKDLKLIEPELDKLNEAWKNASEEIYKAQADASKSSQAGTSESKAKNKSGDSPGKGGDDVQDVDFEEVK